MAQTEELTPISIVFGIGGINQSPNTDRRPITDVEDADTVTFEDDTMGKEGGAQKLNTTAITGNPSIVGLHDFQIPPSTRYIVAATADGKIITVLTGGIGQTLKSGLGLNVQTVFVEGATGKTKKLFAFNGSDPVQVWDGISGATHNLATPPADWTAGKPTAGVLHDNALWAWGNTNAPHTVYKSKNADHEDFTIGTQAIDGLSFDVFPGEGTGIVAAISFWGRLFLFKNPYGIYWIDDNDPSAANWVVRKLTGSIGMSGPLGISPTDTDVYFLGSDGLVHILSAVNTFADVTSTVLDPHKLSAFMQNTINPNRKGRAIATYHTTKQKWYLAFSNGGLTNDQRMTVDIHVPGQRMAARSSRDIAEAMCVADDVFLTFPSGQQQILIGDNNGFVWQLNRTSRTKDGNAYNGLCKTSSIPLFKGGQRRANLHALEAVLKQDAGPVTLNVNVELDGKPPQAVTFTVSQVTGFVLGSGRLGTDVLAASPNASKNTQKKRLTGDARRVRLTINNNINNQNFELDSLTLWVSPGSDRP